MNKIKQLGLQIKNHAVALNSFTFLYVNMLVSPRSHGGKGVEHLSSVEGLPRLRNQCMSLVVADIGSNPN